MNNLQKMAQQKFTCEICEKSFSTNQYKKRHIKTVHVDEIEWAY